MIEATASATEVKNNFGKYLGIIMAGGEVMITKNGKEVGRLVPKGEAVSYLTDSLRGVLREDLVMEDIRDQYLREKYEIADRR